jgi:hypothetical protein
MAEFLAAEILRRHFPERAGMPSPMVWVEHYPERRIGRELIPEEYDLVSFATSIPTAVRAGNRWRWSLGEPAWTHLSRAAVEHMIGLPLT